MLSDTEKYVDTWDLHQKIRGSYKIETENWIKKGLDESTEIPLMRIFQTCFMLGYSQAARTNSTIEDVREQHSKLDTLRSPTTNEDDLPYSLNAEDGSTQKRLTNEEVAKIVDTARHASRKEFESFKYTLRNDKPFQRKDILSLFGIGACHRIHLIVSHSPVPFLARS